MKKSIITASLMIAALCCNAQKADSAAMMKAWADFMKPGMQHQMMAKSDGTWNGDITMWMAPGAPASKSTGTAENKMILNGLYQQSTHKGSFEGMPFEGISTLGYDNARKVFVSTWVDNMGSGIMYMEGTWDNGTKSINFAGKQTDPMTGKSMNVRETYKIVDDNTHMLEMYCAGPDGKEFKTMEVKYTRK